MRNIVSGMLKFAEDNALQRTLQPRLEKIGARAPDWARFDLKIVLAFLAIGPRFNHLHLVVSPRSRGSMGFMAKER